MSVKTARGRGWGRGSYVISRKIELETAMIISKIKQSKRHVHISFHKKTRKQKDARISRSKSFGPLFTNEICLWHHRLYLAGDSIFLCIALEWSYVCVCAFELISCGHTWVCTCVPLVTSLRVFPQTGSLTGLKVTKQVRLSGLWTPGIQNISTFPPLGLQVHINIYGVLLSLPLFV